MVVKPLGTDDDGANDVQNVAHGGSEVGSSTLREQEPPIHDTVHIVVGGVETGMCGHSLAPEMIDEV